MSKLVARTPNAANADLTLPKTHKIRLLNVFRSELLRIFKLRNRFKVKYPQVKSLGALKKNYLRELLYS